MRDKNLTSDFSNSDDVDLDRREVLASLAKYSATVAGASTVVLSASASVSLASISGSGGDHGGGGRGDLGGGGRGDLGGGGRGDLGGGGRGDGGGRNPGNDKPVGNSPFNGTREEIASGKNG